MRVTVIIANRDQGDSVGDAIASVAGQDADVFVVDDGSQDDSREAVERALSGLGTAEAVFLDESVGPAAARNLAIRAAWDRTDLFAFLDADDVYLPGKVAASRRRFAADPDVSLVYTDERVTSEVSGRTFTNYREPFNYARHVASDVVGANYVVSKAALAKFGPFDTRMAVAEMYELSLRLSAHSAVAHVPEVLAHTRVTPGCLRRTVPGPEWDRHAGYARGKVAGA